MRGKSQEVVCPSLNSTSAVKCTFQFFGWENIFQVFQNPIRQMYWRKGGSIDQYSGNGGTIQSTKVRTWNSMNNEIIGLRTRSHAFTSIIRFSISTIAQSLQT